MKTGIVCALGLVAFGLVGGCGGGSTTAVTTVPTAHLAVTPDSASAETGTPFTFTVSALDASGAVVPTYTGRVHISSTDPSASLPNDVTLPRGTGKLTLVFGTAGSHTITASDTAGNALAGISAGITVTVGAGNGPGNTGSVHIVPTAIVIPAGRDYQFTYWYSSSDPAVESWSVMEGDSGGSISHRGAYTAPSTPGTYHVIFTASGLGSATAVVTVTDKPLATTPMGSMQLARGAFTATLLAGGPAATNGKVLVAGGNGDFTNAVIGIGNAELYDPSTGMFTATGSMISPRYAHSATLLPNGKVLLAGGMGDSSNTGTDLVPPQALASAELYDPATGTFTPTGSMHVARASHTATLLPGGRVLIVGGADGPGTGYGHYPYFDSRPLATAEIYDVATGVFTQTGDLTTGRFAHTATLLGDGTVLVAGGVASTDWMAGTARWTSAAEIYDPATGKFTATGSMNLLRNLHTATLLGDGRVLMAGGSNNDASVELYDPGTHAFSMGGSMLSVRSAHTATLLDDGRVLLAGGALVAECVQGNRDYCQPVISIEVFDPSTGTFSAVGFMDAARWAHEAILLDSKEVLLVGGEGLASAELLKSVPN
jgi:hypothetical protein